MTELENMLKGAKINQPIAVVKMLVIAGAQFMVEETEQGYTLHFDLVLSPQTAERFSIPFDLAGWERFKSTLLAAGSGIELASPGPPNLRGLH